MNAFEKYRMVNIVSSAAALLLAIIDFAVLRLFYSESSFLFFSVLILSANIIRISSHRLMKYIVPAVLINGAVILLSIYTISILLMLGWGALFVGGGIPAFWFLCTLACLLLIANCMVDFYFLGKNKK